MWKPIKFIYSTERGAATVLQDTEFGTWSYYVTVGGRAASCDTWGMDENTAKREALAALKFLEQQLCDLSDSPE